MTKRRVTKPGVTKPRVTNRRAFWTWRAAGLLALSILLLGTPFDGALGLAKLLAFGVYLCVFALPSPCKGGAAYPFGHGFRPGAGCPRPDQPEEGTASAGAGEELAPITRLPSAATAPEATSRSARG